MVLYITVISIVYSKRRETMKMKVRKKAVAALQQALDIDIAKAKQIEKTVFYAVGGKTSHQRVIRQLMKDKKLTIRKAIANLHLDIAIEKVQHEDFSDLVEEGEIVCRKCGSRKISKRSLQTRSGDEGATIFYHCVVCKSRWKQS